MGSLVRLTVVVVVKARGRMYSVDDTSIHHMTCLQFDFKTVNANVNFFVCKS